MKQLKTPVMDNLDNLSNDELEFYYDYWKKIYDSSVKSHEEVKEKYEKIVLESLRRIRKNEYKD